MTRRLKWLLAIAVVLAISGLAAAVWGEARESRAAALAVKYGFASSKGDATLADRCAGVMREEYETTDDPAKAGVGEEAFVELVPRVCALGVQRGLIASDGTMSEESGFRLATDVINQMGPDRVQMMTFNDLAVDYGLARPGRATRWHRCVAMAYAGYDAQPADAGLPPKEQWRRAAREACTEGIKRGIVPASGAPAVDSADAHELFGLICSKARELTSPCV